MTSKTIPHSAQRQTVITALLMILVHRRITIDELAHSLQCVCVCVCVCVCIHTLNPKYLTKKHWWTANARGPWKRGLLPPIHNEKQNWEKNPNGAVLQVLMKRSVAQNDSLMSKVFFLFCFFSCFFCHLRFILAKLQNWQAARQLVSEVPLFSLLCGMNVSRLHAVCLSPLRQVSVPPRMQISRNRLSAPGARTRWLSSASSCRVK